MNVEHVFAVTEPPGECMHAECEEQVVAVYPVLTRDRGPEFYFLCPEHADSMRESVEDLAQDLPQQEARKSSVAAILPTCGWGPPGGSAPCGAGAPYVVMVGVRNDAGEPTVVTMSCCAKHLPPEADRKY